MYILLIY